MDRWNFSPGCRTDVSLISEATEEHPGRVIVIKFGGSGPTNPSGGAPFFEMMIDFPQIAPLKAGTVMCWNRMCARWGGTAQNSPIEFELSGYPWMSFDSQGRFLPLVWRGTNGLMSNPVPIYGTSAAPMAVTLLYPENFLQKNVLYFTGTRITGRLNFISMFSELVLIEPGANHRAIR